MATYNKQLKPGVKRSYVLISFLIFIALAGVIFLYLCFNNIEILEKGELLSYTTGEIYKVRFFNSFIVYIEREVLTIPDYLNIYLLAGMTFICFTFSIIATVIGKDVSSKFFWFFLVLFLGLSYLFFDEMVGIHETLGHNLRFLMSLPFVKRPDDFIIMLYAIPAGFFLIYFHRVILSSRKAVFCFSLTVIAFLMAALSDLLTIHFEEFFEILSSLFLVIGILIIGLDYIQQILSPGLTNKD